MATPKQAMSKQDRPRRVMLQLSESEYELATLWAKWHGKPLATYLGQLIGSRVAANRDEILGNIEATARIRGMDPDELIKEWLAEDEGEE